MAKQLHIANGDDLGQNISELKIDGEIIIWREMLCEGATTYTVGDEEFVKLRKDFLKENYKISPQEYEEQFLAEFRKFDTNTEYDEVILWFEFDLFSHINMLAAISHLMENKKLKPVKLVCSKKLKGEKEFTILSQLSLKNLKNHYDARISLNEDDLEVANVIWQYYNGTNPQKLKGLIKQKTNFEYLSSCIRAHIERFPNAATGLNSLEKNVLKIIDSNKVSNLNHLIGYMLEYQGYYGYNEKQMRRLLEKVHLFYEIGEDRIVLTEAGKEALAGKRNFYRILKNDEMLGGVKLYDYLYDSTSHSILKL